MNLLWRKMIWLPVVAFYLGIFSAGCTTKSSARLTAENAFLAGQNTVLRQQAQTQGVTVVGSVQNPQVAWVAGLTLAQAIATANYIGSADPKQIIITRQGESAVLDAAVLLDGTVIPLEIGDVIELR